jgi:hypothetical protein
MSLIRSAETEKSLPTEYCLLILVIFVSTVSWFMFIKFRFSAECLTGGLLFLHSICLFSTRLSELHSTLYIGLSPCLSFLSTTSSLCLFSHFSGHVCHVFKLLNHTIKYGQSLSVKAVCDKNLNFIFITFKIISCRNTDIKEGHSLSWLLCVEML